jgi:hypothetical protein
MAYMILCVHLHLAVTSFGATLDMGGWLDLAQQGLSPCKRYQTSWRTNVRSVHEASYLTIAMNA